MFHDFYCYYDPPGLAEPTQCPIVDPGSGLPDLLQLLIQPRTAWTSSLGAACSNLPEPGIKVRILVKDGQ